MGIELHIIPIILLIIFSYIESTSIQKKSNIKENICVLMIGYEITYDESSVLKVVINTYNDLLSANIHFKAKLKSEKGKEYILNCHNTSVTSIDCYSQKDIKFDLNDKHYFYYDRGDDGVYTLEEKDVYEDERHINLIFKPEIYKDQIIYKDFRKILGVNDRKIVGGGYLYLLPQNKKMLLKSKDSFNRYIDYNNFIAHSGLYGQKPHSTLAAYKEADRRGFHIVNANIQFTKDKIPVIYNGDDISNDSNGKGKICENTLSELKKLDFGSKFSLKYEGESILTFEELLKFCKERNLILDLDLGQLDFQEYFVKSDEYAKKIIDMVEQYEMIDSTIFNDGQNPDILLILKKLKNEISISISNSKDLKDINSLDAKYKGSKRIILEIKGLEQGEKINESLIKKAKYLGYKVKASIVDDLEIADKLQKLGVNFITTNKLHPFYIRNDYMEPIFLKCTQFDVLDECLLSLKIDLVDNTIYNIYYSDNIYNIYEDINPKPIGEVKYLSTNQQDDFFFNVTYFNFTEKKLQLRTSVNMSIGENIYVAVGPSGYENVSECYRHYFLCKGKEGPELLCEYVKTKDRVEFEGNYSVYMAENFSSYSPPPIKNEPSQGKLIMFMQKHSEIIAPIIVIIVFVGFLFTFSKKGYSHKMMEDVKII